MNENDIIDILNQDANMREANRRFEQKLPAMPAVLNERVTQRLNAEGKRQKRIKKTWWIVGTLTSVSAACVILFLTHILSVEKNEKDTGTTSPMVKTKTVERKTNQTAQRDIPTQENPNLQMEMTSTTETEFIAKTEDATSNPATEIEKNEINNVIPKQDKTKSQERTLAKENSAKPETGKKVPKDGVGKIAPENGIGKESLLAENPEEYQGNPKFRPTKSKGGSAKQYKVYSDTIGSRIFQSPENALIAIRMLRECDDIINHETQEIRNEIIEATFNVAPPSGKAILVKDENGDLNVMETGKTRIIEL